MEHINPEKELSKEHFIELFEQLPLNNKEAYKVVNIYWPLYEKMVEHPEVEPVTAWLAVKNTFVAKEPQVGERMQQQ